MPYQLFRGTRVDIDAFSYCKRQVDYFLGFEGCFGVSYFGVKFRVVLRFSSLNK